MANKKKKSSNKSNKKKSKNNAARSSSGKSKRNIKSGSVKKNRAPKMTATEKAMLEREEKRKQRRNHVILGVILFAIGAFLAISMFAKSAGALGSWISNTVLGLFGAIGFLLPIYFLIYAVLLLINKGSRRGKYETILFVTVFFILMSVFYSIGKLGDVSEISFGGAWLKGYWNLGITGQGGGMVGMLISFLLAKVIGKGGAYIFIVACMIISLLLIADKPLYWVYEKIAGFISAQREKMDMRYTEDFYDGEEDDYDDYEKHRKPEPENEIIDEKQNERNAMINKAGSKKSIINYLREDESELFSTKDDMAELDLEDITNLKPQKPQNTTAKAAETEASENGEVAEEKHFGLEDADALYFKSSRWGRRAHRKAAEAQKKLKPETNEDPFESIYGESGFFNFASKKVEEPKTSAKPEASTNANEFNDMFTQSKDSGAAPQLGLGDNDLLLFGKKKPHKTKNEHTAKPYKAKTQNRGLPLSDWEKAFLFPDAENQEENKAEASEAESTNLGFEDMKIDPMDFTFTDIEHENLENELSEEAGSFAGASELADAEKTESAEAEAEASKGAVKAARTIDAAGPVGTAPQAAAEAAAKAAAIDMNSATNAAIAKAIAAAVSKSEPNPVKGGASNSKTSAHKAHPQKKKVISTNEVGNEKNTAEPEYELPPIELLNSNVFTNRSNENLELSSKAALLEKTLQSFNVKAKVIKVSRGPAVTRFEVQPATGVKVNSIVRLQDDIALNLEARSIRMEAPIPGKAAVGIEIENEEKKAVFLREVIESEVFKRSPSKITFAVGRDVSGNPIVANLKDMPHLLIAGSTGSGKSVCVNSIIMSFLYKAKPSEVKLIMVDPKVVELSNYNGIPHLLIPVVTEPAKAAIALNWAVKEMEDRYRKFQEVNVRELSRYNKKAASDPQLEPMPQIVIIIDELADLMMAAPQQVEDAICRLAQKARAAGMHLIVATQRPSVDVITGVIKANIPSRAAFAVSSQIDSRTILDCSGAEKLVGKGDMLFNPLGMGKPLRVQGTFVSDEEVQAVIDYVSSQGHEQEFSNDLMDTMETSKMDYNDEEVDELLRDAIEFVVHQKQASVSMLQRKFRIGYNRAARIIDAMEERGIVGSPDGSRPRRVFLSQEGLDALDENCNYISGADSQDEADYYDEEEISDSHEDSQAELN